MPKQPKPTDAFQTHLADQATFHKRESKKLLREVKIIKRRFALLNKKTKTV